MARDDTEALLALLENIYGLEGAEALEAYRRRDVAARLEATEELLKETLEELRDEQHQDGDWGGD